MPLEQLCFFKFSRPLLERFGADFFRQVPSSPGVYIFTGSLDRVLYVGQSKNLRSRLSYYKNAQPEREPRRIIRLVHQVAGIQIETCETVLAARRRELALIRQHRPRFNIANTLSPTFTFFGLRQTSKGFSLRLSMKPLRYDGEQLIGAFRNRGLCGRAFRAIARALVAESREIDSVYAFPIGLQTKATEWNGLEPRWHSSVQALLSGENADFIELTAGLAARASDLFLQQLFESDLLTLTEFFQLAVQMREVRSALDLGVVPQDALQVSGSVRAPRAVSTGPPELLERQQEQGHSDAGTICVPSAFEFTVPAVP